jgi:signal transduction histidine kinase
MAYRISLHLLATLWHVLLAALALSLRKTHRTYSSLILVCLFSAAFTAAWGVGLIFQSEWAMRLTWVGALWPAAFLIFIREMFHLPTSRFMKICIGGIGMLCTIGGLTPYCLVKIQSYDPMVVAVYGWLEPFMRVSLLIPLGAILWTVIPLLFSPGTETTRATRVGLIGFALYGIGASFSGALLPLFGEYRLLESTSYCSVIWTTFAAWYVFKELQERNKSLMELDTFKKELINHVTHEFRTPLSAIASAVDVIENSQPGDKRKVDDYLHMIQSNTGRLSHFVDELLDLAAIQQAKIRLTKSETDLFSLIENAITRLRPLAEKQRVAISLNGNSLSYECDQEKMDQVIVNLISNAIKASPNGGIEITLSQQQGRIEISVLDNGIGIPPEHIEHVFSSFYSIATKSSSIKGSGLGLAIAKGWIDAHGGKIDVKSKGSGTGAEFKISLPLIGTEGA